MLKNKTQDFHFNYSRDEDLISLDTKKITFDDFMNDCSMLTIQTAPQLNTKLKSHHQKDKENCSLQTAPITSAAPEDDVKKLIEETRTITCKKNLSLDNINVPAFSEIQSIIEASEDVSLQTKESQISQSDIEDDTLPYKNPIEFLHYIETVYIKSLYEDGRKDAFYLQNYKMKKIFVFNITKKPTLIQRLYKGGNIIVSVTAHNDLLFAGNNLGIVGMYSWDKEYEYKSYTLNEIDSCTEKSVMCMDVSGDGNYLICGHSNGYIALWDIKATKCHKLIKKAHKSSVIACKFICADSKKHEIVSSDIDGNVVKEIVREGLFSVSVEVIPLLKIDIPVFLMNILHFTDEEKKTYECCRAQAVIAALGNNDGISIFMLEPESKRLCKIERPKYIQDTYIPDISFGIGYQPSNPAPSDFECESIFEMAVNQSTMSINQACGDVSKPQILFAVSWERFIYVYCVQISSLSVSIVGHYISNEPILRMGFLSNSILFFFDVTKTLKVINTSLINPGMVRLHCDDGSPFEFSYTNRKPELDDGKIIDPFSLHQTILVDPNKKIRNDIYTNFIVNTHKNIFVLAKKDFYHGRLLNWEQSLLDLEKQSEWMDAFVLGLDIYHGKTTALADIPMDSNARKKKVGQVLKVLISKYAEMNCGNDESSIIFSADKTFKSRLAKCMCICIEFCIEIESIDYLFTNIQPIFYSKGYGDEFIIKLEPFILAEKFINQPLKPETVMTIMNMYIRNEKINMLSQILIHLHSESIDIDPVKTICSEKNLLTPLIHIYMNGSNEDYFYPVQKIFQVFNKSKEILKSYFVSYSDCLKTMPFADLEVSKQYTGHKLLWYINLCLNGKRYPTNQKMDEDKFNQIVSSITNWLLSDPILATMLRFDSFSLFIILTRIFTDEKMLQIISSPNYLPSPNQQLAGLKPLGLIDIIVGKCKEINNNTFVLQDMYEFIAKISGYVQLSKELILEAGGFLLTYNYREKETNNASDLDMFNSHAHLGHFSKYVQKMSNIIIDMMEKRTDLDKNDYITLLAASELSPFVMVKIHILNQLKLYKRCLEVYLQKETHISDRKQKVFEWIDLTLKALQGTDMQSFEILKEEVLNKLHLLAELSIESVTALVESWFSEQQDTVIHKLDKVKNLQLKYVENILQKPRDDLDGINENEKKFESYVLLLLLHIKLLCKLNKKDQVLKNLIKRPLYPVEKCLKTCLKYKVYDASIYLYQSIGAVKDALDLANDILCNSFKSVLILLNSSFIRENNLSAMLDQLKGNIKQCVDICENHPENSEDLWFQLLKQLYTFLEVLKDSAIEARRAYYDDIIQRISKEIKEILEKMCSYVGIQRIIENVTYNYHHAEFKEFKNLLLNMLYSYSHLKNILSSAKNLLKNSILYNIIELKKMNQKGNKYFLFRCDYCGKRFVHMEDEAIFAFRCGHKLHLSCIIKTEDETICIICLKNEIESSVTGANVSLIQTTQNALIHSQIDMSEIHESSISKGRRDAIHRNLKTIDKYYNEKDSLL